MGGRCTLDARDKEAGRSEGLASAMTESALLDHPKAIPAFLRARRLARLSEGGLISSLIDRLPSSATPLFL